MIIKRILNNNAVMSVDESGEDIIVKGRRVVMKSIKIKLIKYLLLKIRK